MRIWIDLSNSPHPLLFAPVVRRLESEGHAVLVTARDNAQTVELARTHWPDVDVIGGSSPGGRTAKARTIARRVFDLRRWATRARPDVALSHNSYAQIVAASSLRIPIVTAMDFEHQPANGLAFRLASTILLPDVLPRHALQRQGVKASKVRPYPGLKEELYIGDFVPDDEILAKLGLAKRPRVLVVVRTPPSRALYHSFGNPMFEAALRAICAGHDVGCVVLARHPEQVKGVKAMALPNCIVPEKAVDSRSLMYVADAMIGAGGTMTREAALMGVPTWTMFAGTPPAVDRWLERQGRLCRLTDPDPLSGLGPRPVEPVKPSVLRERSAAIEQAFVTATLSATPPSQRANSQGLHDAVSAARTLEEWGHSRGWQGPDPYDALNATRLASALRRSPMARRILTQAVKRSPVDIRPALGIRPGLSAATLGVLISAYARNGFLDSSWREERLAHCMTELEGLRCAAFHEPCWGYHFDVQTRVFFYPRTVPNTIATAFAGLGLLDAYEYCGNERALELAVGAGEFFMRHVPQTDTGRGAYFGYLPGDSTPIHNANMLVSALLARLFATLGNEDLRDRAAKGIEYTAARQRPDGSWPYGELPHLQWVDGFHTGYVLDALRACAGAGVAHERADEAWHRGLGFYAEALIEPDGTPRYTPEARYPVDGQCVAQAIQTLSMAAPIEPQIAARRWKVLSYALTKFARRDGAFAFQRERLWLNTTPHPRWVEAPMLLALSHLIATA